MAKDLWVGYPVSLLGEQKFHILIKDFCSAEVSIDEISEILEDFEPDSPRKLSFTPITHNNSYLLKLHNWPRSWLELNKLFSVLKDDENFSPYIEVPKDLWEDTLRNDLTLIDLEFEIGGLSIFSGDRKVFEFSNQSEVTGQGNYQRAIQTKKVYKLIEEIIEKHFPKMKARPFIDVKYNVDFLGKTLWKKQSEEKVSTEIQLSHKVIDEDEELLRQILTHELVHHYLYQKYLGQVAGHGELFDLVADKINKVEGPGYVAPYANDTNFVKEPQKIKGANEKIKIFVVQAGTRAKNDCPGVDTKLVWVVDQLKELVPEDVELDIFDLRVRNDGKLIRPCKGCVGTAGGYHCSWFTSGIKGHPRYRGCSCYAPGEKYEDLLHDEYVYYRMEQADGFFFLTPIHWFAATTGLKAMFDRLVCANMTVPAEVIAEVTDDDIKNPKKTVSLEQSGEFDHLQKNYYEDKVAAFFANGDDGADDYEKSTEKYPDTFGDISRDEFLEKTHSDPNRALWPYIMQMKYMGVHVPDHLVCTILRGDGEEYSYNDQTFKGDEEFLQCAIDVFDSLIEEVRIKRAS